MEKEINMPTNRAKHTGSGELPPRRPALTPEARENQMISLAFDAAERQLMDGTASAQVITHFLKLATVREQKELEKIELEKQLLEAKKGAIESEQHASELFDEAIKAFSTYSGGNKSE